MNDVTAKVKLDPGSADCRAVLALLIEKAPATLDDQDIDDNQTLQFYADAAMAVLIFGETFGISSSQMLHIIASGDEAVAKAGAFLAGQLAGNDND